MNKTEITPKSEFQDLNRANLATYNTIHSEWNLIIIRNIQFFVKSATET
jgi:hypothetical protein